METESNIPPLQQVRDGRTLQSSSADRYQQVKLDAAALGAIDIAWLDARESSRIDPGIMDKLNGIGQTY